MLAKRDGASSETKKLDYYDGVPILMIKLKESEREGKYAEK